MLYNGAQLCHVTFREERRENIAPTSNSSSTSMHCFTTYFVVMNLRCRMLRHTIAGIQKEALSCMDR